jgi:hypothetical protein
METLRLARATHQLLERGVEALEKIGRELSGTTTDRSAPTTLARDSTQSLDQIQSAGFQYTPTPEQIARIQRN